MILPQDRKRTFKKDRIEGDQIFLNGDGKFPKSIIIENHHRKERLNYRLIKTKSGKFQLNK